MLKRLLNRLHIIMTGILMALITLILSFFFRTSYQSSQTADITYIQRMASLIIYQLEADTEAPETVLSDYEEQMNVYAVLRDPDGAILYKSRPGFPTDFDVLLQKADQSIGIQNASGFQSTKQVTEQGGFIELKGLHHDRYYAVPAAVSTQEGESLSLTLVYPQNSAVELFLSHAPLYLAIWLISFAVILFVSRFLLKKAFAPSEQMIRSQKDFVAAASHELKAPLAVIMANTEALQDMLGIQDVQNTRDMQNARDMQNTQSHGQIASQPQACLDVIDAECSRMSRLVRDMLLLASSDADKWTIQKSEINVDTLLITLYEAYEPVCISKKIRLELDLSEETYPVLSSDRERLFQILSIFLDNAVCYSPEGSSIQIRTAADEKELVFSVADHGKGIPEEDKAFIFDRFYRGDRSRTDRSHFGLGLSIAKELAKMLGGEIGFKDTKGGGATFFLKLPVRS